MRFNRRIIIAGSAVALTMAAAMGAEAQERTLRFAHHLPTASEQHIAAERFAERVSAITNGALAVEILPAGQMGGQREIIESVQLGTLDMGYGESGLYANYVPAFGILSLPYLYGSEEHWTKVVDGEIGSGLADQLAGQANIKVLNWILAGYRDTYLAEKPINAPADFEGVKIRVPESPVFIETFAALGAQPTPVPGPEMYTALQTRLVDAMEGTPEVAVTYKIFEVANYGSKTRHILFDGSFAINNDLFNDLPADQQEAILSAAQEVAEQQRAERAERENGWFEQLAELGMNLNEVDTGPFQEALVPVQDAFAEKAGATELLAEIRAAQ
ncbi:MAG: TRAP transporter substrate-binding protein [Geminicoccaceae bacterium]